MYPPFYAMIKMYAFYSRYYIFLIIKLMVAIYQKVGNTSLPGGLEGDILLIGSWLSGVAG